MKLSIMTIAQLFAVLLVAASATAATQDRELALQQPIGGACKSDSDCHTSMYCNEGKCARDGSCNDVEDCYNPSNKLKPYLSSGKFLLKCRPNKWGLYASQKGRNKSVGRCVRDNSSGNRCPENLQPPMQCRRKACSPEDCKEKAVSCVDRNCGSCSDILFFNTTGHQVCAPKGPPKDPCFGFPCARPVCPPGVDPIIPPGKCCPVCPIVTPVCTKDLCPKPICPNGAKAIVPKGKCCPICPPTPAIGCDTCPSGKFNDGCNTCTCEKDGTTSCTELACLRQGKPFCIDDKPSCSTVSCLKPVCGKGIVPFTPKGECCPICPKKPDCSKVDCRPVKCERGFEAIVPVGQCCPICLPGKTDCSTVDCLEPVCEKGVSPIVPVGQCCPICPKKPDCSTVKCREPICAKGVSPIVPIGQCCPICPKGPDCSTVKCRQIKCNIGYKLHVPNGKCCPECIRDASIPDCSTGNCAKDQIKALP